MEQLAPIALFVYNRPDHTSQTIEALSKNPLAQHSNLYVFADGPKEGLNDEQLEQIQKVRDLIQDIKGFNNVTLYESEKNKGLATSIVSGVKSILENYDRILILEDDLVVAPSYLDFMNESLETYKDRENVYSVNGFMFPFDYPESKSVLLPYSSTWGWGTWKNKWTAFSLEMDHKDFIKSNEFIKSRFNLADYPYDKMLDFGNNSWGIKWYYSVFIRNGLGVFPTKSLIQNIGQDGSGENQDNTNYDVDIDSVKIKVTKEETIDVPFWNDYMLFFKGANKTEVDKLPLLKRIVNRLRR